MKNRLALLIDFGSTYTKLRAVDLLSARIVGSSQGPSTVGSDVTIGMMAAMRDLEKAMGKLPEFEVRLASSSAAGGLRMVTVGLIRELTAEAARQAALGAGAKLVGHFHGKLNRSDLERIQSIAPDIILLAGGTDGGDEDVIAFNAGAIAAARLDCPVISAGNRSAADAVEQTFLSEGKQVVVAGNVMPEFGVLDVDPARAAIRSVFMDRIVHAKGIDGAASLFDEVLMPTPAAVLDGAKLVAEGPAEGNGLGDLMIVDLGGATTDVHSLCSGAPSSGDVIVLGLPEPFAKRTVEGDLGMRINARTIVETAGVEEFSKSTGLSAEAVGAMLDDIEQDTDRLPATESERIMDRELARIAIQIAARRHAGTRETVYGPHGPMSVQRGKDLSGVRLVIGTGGAIVHAPDPLQVLQPILAAGADTGSLRPTSPAFFLDKTYSLYAVGLLAQYDKSAAYKLAINHLTPVG